MSFNWEAENTQWFVDQENKMMLAKDPAWNPDGNNGFGDAIGRNFVTYVCYKDKRFIEGIKKCWVKVKQKGLMRLFRKWKYQGYRYPHRYENEVGISRDHTLYTVLAYKYSGMPDKELNKFVKRISFKLSKAALQTIDMWLWMRVISGSKFWKPLFYLMSWCELAFTASWEKLIEKIYKLGPEVHQDDFHHMQNGDKPKRIQRAIKLYYPTYALIIGAWKIKMLPDGKWKKKLQKQALRLVPKHNYLIQILLDSPNMPTQEIIDGYEPMNSRWGGILNVWKNDRDLQKIIDPVRLEYNVMDVDYLKVVWGEYKF